jgi:hypothetical protein
VQKRTAATVTGLGDGACTVRDVLPDPEPIRLYFLHIPKTAGTSMGAVVQHAVSAAATYPPGFVGDFLTEDAASLARWQVFRGHFGLAPWTLLTPRPFTVTVLRDPATRAWSQIRAQQQRQEGTLRGPLRSVEEYLLDPHLRGMTTNYQARWLWRAPTLADAESIPADLRPAGATTTALAHWGFGQAPLPPDDELAAAATTTLGRCDVVGVSERLDDVVEVLGRHLGLPLGRPDRLNVGAAPAPLDPAGARLLRERSWIDVALHAEAERRLDHDLATVVRPDLPLTDLPLLAEPVGPWCADGFDAPVHAEGVGWRAATGVGRTAEVRFPHRAGGGARVVIEVDGADAATTAATRVTVQGVPLAPGRLHGPVVLRPDRPLTVGITVDGGPGLDADGLRVAAVRLLPRRVGDEGEGVEGGPAR